MLDSPGAAQAMAHREQVKAVQVLMGLVTGMVADRNLHDLEIQFLSTWLSENPGVTAGWPGSVVAERVRAVLADGVVSEDERSHLLETLLQLCATDFAQTGSAAPEVAQLPIDHDVTVDVRDQMVCHTGTFLFGTRSACERLTLAGGGTPVDSVTRQVAYLVVGSNVSPSWVNTSYGRKIEAAMRLKLDGRPIAIVTERQWLQSLGAA